MPTFHRLAAAITDPHMHVEATINHGPRNLRLVLRRDMGFTHLTFAAMRALRRQWHVVRFIDPWRHGALGMRPMPASRFAAGFFRLGCRLILLAKGSRLPLARATQLLHHLLQFRNPRFQPLNHSMQSPILIDQLLVGRSAHRRTDRFVSRRVHNWLYDESSAK